MAMIIIKMNGTRSEKTVRYIKIHDTKYTTISEIAKALCAGKNEHYRQIRGFVASCIYDNTLKENEFMKLEPRHSKDLEGTLPTSNFANGLVIIKLSAVNKIVKKINFKVDRVIEGKYKVDRFMGKKRNLYDELVYSLKINDVKLKPNEFKATLSFLSFIENGSLNKKDAVRKSSERFGVTQKRIREIASLTDYESRKRSEQQNYYGNVMKDCFISRNKVKKAMES